MYLVLEPQAANIRNVTQAIINGCDILSSNKVWNEIPVANGLIALDVKDGEGLSDEELAACVDTIELPNE